MGVPIGVAKRPAMNPPGINREIDRRLYSLLFYRFDQ